MESESQFAAAVNGGAAARNSSGIRARAGAGLSDEITPLLPEAIEDNDSDRGDDSRDSNWAGNDEFEGKPWWKKPSVFWLLPPLLPFTIAFGGILVPKINLILGLVCRDYFQDKAAKDPTFTYLPVIFGGENPQCQIAEVQAAASRIQLYSNLITGALSAIVSPKLGSLSDKYGRNKLIAVTTLGTLLGELVTAVVAATPETSSVYTILFGYFLDGLGGSVTTAMALMGSYASDCSPPERRNVTFGYFQGALFSGIALGPLIAGLIIKWTDNVLIVFIGCFACHLFFLVFLLAVIPESLSKNRQRLNREKAKTEVDGLDQQEGSWWLWSWRDLNPLNLLKPLSILYPMTEKPSAAYPDGRSSSPALRRNLISLAAIDTVMFGVGMGAGPITIMYAEFMFGWGNVESSLAVSTMSGVRVIMLLILFPLVTRLVRGPRIGRAHVNTGSDRLDILLIRFAVLFELIGYIGYATVPTGALFFLSAIICGAGAVGSPTLQSSLTQHVHPNSTGQLLGVIGLLHALSRVVAPTVLNLIYSLTVGSFPQTIFVCLVGVFVIAGILSFLIKPHVYVDDTLSSNRARHSDVGAGSPELGPN
ncbi:hypothetical protein FQN54_007663 [Arachnomyces sp. PD_36]|nr:hypothetical protein FQN54_007663 [Arachnomyces sp. PD_36]